MHGGPFFGSRWLGESLQSCRIPHLKYMSQTPRPLSWTVMALFPVDVRLCLADQVHVTNENVEYILKFDEAQ